jgi:hypothetical protein
VNSTGDYSFGSNVAGLAPGQPATVGTASGLYRYIETAAPDDFEMRFTEEGSLGVYVVLAENIIVQFPFEIWNIGDPDNPDDDVQMIASPVVGPCGKTFGDWNESITCGATEGRTAEPIWDLVYWYMPDRPNGYELFEQAAMGFGGPGATYDPENDGDTQIDFSGEFGAPCGDGENQGYYIDFCYRDEDLTGYYAGGTADLGNVYPIGRMAVVDVDGDGEPPPSGTTIRIQTVGLPTAGTEFVLDTSPYLLLTNQSDLAEASMDQITAVPNPYIGRSAYETANAERIMRFTNLPDRATLRVYTISGTLIKELFHNGGRSIDWDLTTTNNLPVASGMYLVHVEGRNADDTVIGERVLKIGVVNRQTQVNVF